MAPSATVASTAASLSFFVTLSDPVIAAMLAATAGAAIVRTIAGAAQTPAVTS
jgi:hypothetical protein